MKQLLEELLSAEAEAERIVADARTEADEVRRKAGIEAEAYRRKRRTEAEARERDLLGKARKQGEEEETRVLAAGDHEVAALRRRFADKREALAEALVRSVVPKI
jgi:vacuolar-type H+-ATPase subunit H